MKPAVAERISEQVRYELGRDHYPEGFPALPEIPGGRYTDDAFYALEIEHLWKKSWLCAIRADEIAKPGQYKLFERLGLSIIIARAADGTINAMHNACRHRGAPIVAGDGKGNLLVCRYHAWCYDLKGRLVRVPEEHDFGDLDKAERSLLPVRCDTWDGWVFINLDPAARPLREDLGVLSEDLAPLQMADLRIKGRLTYRIECNWKAALDAFLEAYHVKAIHPQTVAMLLDAKGTAISLLAGGHTRMALPKRFNTKGGTWGTDAEPYDIPTVPGVFRENNLAYGLFPNMVSPFDSAGFPFISFWPVSKGVCECELIFVGAGDEAETAENSEYWQTFLENYDKIQMEDFQFLAGIQRSLESGAFTGMKLCYQERRIYWMHEEFDRRIGVERIPPALRVAQVLEPFVVG
ncbi:aromatic ring-hydroxylating oxygenase subunit alpha [Sphingomonas profundi]|uniref:aromatic ring-hydroxylating oxygenase subunit alpha n=1 Tax=Alterirhizorhabdus profundi TaxID=2681549 RepID=UPI0018D0B9B3|nr:aromatic ring-hydroxylating dioxygenase subunit alpha [Sphingomonas profundi]